MDIDRIEADEYLKILKAESDTPDHIICPKCGSEMYSIALENGARKIACKKSNCITVTFRGL